MNSKHFDYLDTLAKTGTYTSAAQKLGISQPVLSRYTANLEEELGINLIYQENHRIRLTEAGEIYRSGSQRMKNLDIQLRRQLNRTKGLKRTKLRIGMSPFHGGTVFASYYPAMMGRYPNMDLEIVEGTTFSLIDQLMQGKISSVFSLYSHRTEHVFENASYMKTELLLGLPSDHPLAVQSSFSSYHPLSVSDIGTDYETISAADFRSLEDITFIGLSSDTMVGKIFDLICEQYHFHPHFLWRTSNSLAEGQLLSSGSYAGFVSSNRIHMFPQMRFFHFPIPEYLFAGILYRPDYVPTDPECYLFRQEYERMLKLNPIFLALNRHGKELMERVE